MDRINLELRLTKAVQKDEHGNWFIEGEASNENLDFQEQEILQEALLDSKDYFLKNGVISYDHRHIRPDPDEPNWNPEKYIIGEPVAVYTRGDKTFVKAKLYKKNDIAKEIVDKLESGSSRIKASVGGRKPTVEKCWDNKLKRMVEKVTSVLWDELAITFKPVNQTMDSWALSSAAFVKSLQAGFGTDSMTLTGGGALLPEDLDKGLIIAIAYKDITSYADAIEYLRAKGCSYEDSKEIIRTLMNAKDRIREENFMDDELMKSFEDSLESLAKSVDKKTDEDYDDDEELSLGLDFDEDDEDEELDDEDFDDEDDDDEVEKSKRCKKSQDFMDVSPVIGSIQKALEKQARQLQALTEMQKSLGAAMLGTSRVIKSIADTPSMRKSVISRNERFGASEPTSVLNKETLIAKSTQLVKEGKISLMDGAKIEDRLNKGLALPDAVMQMLK